MRNELSFGHKSAQEESPEMVRLLDGRLAARFYEPQKAVMRNPYVPLEESSFSNPIKKFRLALLHVSLSNGFATTQTFLPPSHHNEYTKVPSERIPIWVTTDIYCLVEDSGLAFMVNKKLPEYQSSLLLARECIEGLSYKGLSSIKINRHNSDGMQCQLSMV